MDPTPQSTSNNIRLHDATTQAQRLHRIAEMCATVKMARTVWLHQHGVPISEEFANFADVLGALLEFGSESEGHAEEIFAALRELSTALGNPAFEFQPDEMEAGLIRYAANWILKRMEEEELRLEEERFLESAERDLLPKMKGSALSIAIFSGHIDAKLCLEIGAAVCLDTPIILAALKEDRLPAALERAAAAVVRGSPNDPKVKALLSEAIARVAGKAG